MHLHDIEMSEPLNPNFDNESFQSEKFATAQKTLQTAERAILAKKWEKAQKFLYKALDQFNLIHNSPMEARVLDLIGRTFEMTFQWNKSLEYYDNALNLKKGPARTQTNPPEIADSYKRIAKIHLQLNNLESARENIQKAIDILDDENMYFAKAESLFILGKIHYLEKEFTSALFYYNLAVDLLYHQYNSELDLELQENLGLLFRRLGQYENSTQAYRKTLKLLLKSNSYPTIGAILTQIAKNYLDHDDSKKALEVIRESIKIREKLGYDGVRTQIAQEKLLKARILYHDKQFNIAESTCEQIIERADEMQNERLLMNSLMLYAQIQIAQLSNSEEDKSLIRNYLSEAKEHAKNLLDINSECEILLIEASFAESLNQVEKILQILEQAENLAKENQKHRILVKVKIQQGFYYHTHNNFEKALNQFKQALNFAQDHVFGEDLAEIYYNLACLSALLHLGEASFENLKKAVNLNLKYKQIASNDKDFTGLWKEDIFKDIVKLD